MLLVCTGPDSFQALRKAQELERAYREKHDPTGLSVDRLPATKSLEVLAERMGSIGLFSQRRCLRATNLVSSWKKADWDRAAKLFARDPEETIVITVEDDLPADAEKQIASWDRCRVYRHAIKTGTDFERYAEQLAQEQNVAFTPELRQFARVLEGDAWTFWQALPRWKATATLPELASPEVSVFAKSDAFLLSVGEERFRAFADEEDMTPLMLQQARQGLRILAREADPRTPSFAQRKWQGLSVQQKKMLLKRTNDLIVGTVAQRLGGLTADELQTVL